MSCFPFQLYSPCSSSSIGSPLSSNDDFTQSHDDYQQSTYSNLGSISLNAMTQYMCGEANSIRAKPRIWSHEEDNKLKEAVELYGIGAWAKIASYVGNGRTKAQCTQRWARGINPAISKNPWSKEDDIKLISLIKDPRKISWAYVASYFPDRCDVQCRYRYKLLLKKRSIDDLRMEAQMENQIENIKQFHEKIILPPISSFLELCSA